MEPITELAPGEVFVFGANRTGLHAAGAARAAHDRFGAIWGQGEGLQGSSYGIDTMSGLDEMRAQIARFLAFATEHPELRFLVTPIGTGIAGHAAEDVAPSLADAPGNVVLPPEFVAILSEG